LANSWEVKLPRGKPFDLKLKIISFNKLIIFLSDMYCSKICIKTSWSMLAKNFLMSHFKIQQILVLFLETI
jgi:hypothetical protein